MVKKRKHPRNKKLVAMSVAMNAPIESNPSTSDARPKTSASDKDEKSEMHVAMYMLRTVADCMAKAMTPTSVRLCGFTASMTIKYAEDTSIPVSNRR